MPYTQRRFDAGDSIEELTSLLHDAYADHAAAGRRFFASYQTAADTARRIARGECWITLDGTTLVGTVTIVAPYSFPTGYPAPEGTGTFYQLAVRPDRQCAGLGSNLVEFAERRTRELGGTAVTIDTSIRATELLDWYRRRGYRERGHWKWDVTNYESIVLSKDLK